VGGADVPDYDVIVVGSGFGGSVTALRLTEKGYRVGVLEAGRRFADHEFAKNSWHTRDYIFAPALGCYGILRMTLLRDAFVMSGAGVGGGSLGYANTLYEPLEAFYHDPQWARITDWREELAPYFDQAKRMLGVATNPAVTEADRVLREVAEDLGVDATFHPTQVGVHFGAPGARPGEEVDDPYFGGAGPRRRTCTHCGECMTGCRHNAKNTTVKNYLYLAEKAGATVHPLTTVTAIEPLETGGYAVHTVRTGGKLRRGRRTFTADQVVLSAAALGTQRLLHRMRDEGRLPHLSPRLGELSRTNSEAVLAARARNGKIDYSKGVAITSSIHPSEDTHVEVVRYGRGSNALSFLGALLVDPQAGRARWLLGLRELARNWRELPKLHNPRHWSEQTIIVLVMQTLDNSLTTFTRRGVFGRRMTTRQGTGEPNPTWIPVGHEITRRIAAKIGGTPGGGWNDWANIPITAHFIGGCPIGESAQTGVIDPWQRVFGHPGLHVVDGSAITANLGVNPSLTITAQSERAMAFWPNKGDPDPRPALGSSYRRVEPVEPKHPVVPAGAPGALRLPITPV
jgi:cholesterol oxidase